MSCDSEIGDRLAVKATLTDLDSLCASFLRQRETKETKKSKTNLLYADKLKLVKKLYPVICRLPDKQHRLLRNDKKAGRHIKMNFQPLHIFLGL